jgi:hypothetical protein
MTGLSTVNRVVLRGRAHEQEALAALLAAAAQGNGGALFLRGETGVGKTVLLSAAAASAADFHVLATSGSEREATLSFAGLHRLLRPVMERAARLPAGQADALVRAFDGEADHGELLTLSVAALSLLCDLAGDLPVLCCVDDTHWLDSASLDILAFLARRVGTERIAIVFGGCDGVGDAELVPDVAAIRLTGLDHHTSRDGAGRPGARGPRRRRGPAPSPPWPAATRGRWWTWRVPSRPSSVAARPLRRRRCRPTAPCAAPTARGLSRLPADARWLVLLAAADDELDVTDLMRAAKASGMDISALEPAELAGVVHVSGTEVMFPQPLIRSIVYDEATFAQRRAAHQLLAEILDPLAHRLRHSMHLAAVADGPDNQLADELRRSATDGSTRAAASRALERAAELTTEPLAAANFLVGAARHAWEGGEPHRARLLLRKVRAHSAPHVAAQAELLLGEIELRAGATTHARQALLSAAGELGQDRHLAVTAMLRAGRGVAALGRLPALRGHGQQGPGAAPI